MWPSASLFTKDGYDLQWGTNVVGHFLLTKLLIPALLAGARSSPDAKARVVTTASLSAYLDVIDWDSFRPGPARDKLNTYTLYNQSKHVCPSFLRSVSGTNPNARSLSSGKRGICEGARETVWRQGNCLYLC